jgi:hypothetical protein
MNYTIEYFHARIKTEIESWPDSLLADFARIVELIMELRIARRRIREVQNG